MTCPAGRGRFPVGFQRRSRQAPSLIRRAVMAGWSGELLGGLAAGAVGDLHGEGEGASGGGRAGELVVVVDGSVSGHQRTPGRQLPGATDHVQGATPPLREKLCVYAAPTVPCASVDPLAGRVTVSGGAAQTVML